MCCVGDVVCLRATRLVIDGPVAVHVNVDVQFMWRESGDLWLLVAWHTGAVACLAWLVSTHGCEESGLEDGT